VVLVPTRIFGGGVDTQQGRQFDVAPDGRFLINMVPGNAATPIALLQNWHPAVKNRASRGLLRTGRAVFSSARDAIAPHQVRNCPRTVPAIQGAVNVSALTLRR
jgi:hypothetical protein